MCCAELPISLRSWKELPARIIQAAYAPEQFIHDKLFGLQQHTMNLDEFGLKPLFLVRKSFQPAFHYVFLRK
jgi:hypothetical protein